MDQNTENAIRQQLAEAEKHVEQVKAELYSTIGRISALRNLLVKEVVAEVNPKKES